MYWNMKEIEKNWKRLEVPSKYESMRINSDVFLNHQINMLLSIREDSGKTTQHLLYSLCCWWSKKENLHIAYMRTDDDQCARSNVETLFNTIKQFGYIEKLTQGKYNDVVYKYQERKFYMAKTTIIDDKAVTEIAPNYFCFVCSLEKYIKYKSAINDPIMDIIIYDEFMDTTRETKRQMIELCNNISTFLRPLERQDENGAYGKAILLGNNTNQFSFWFEEFCIENDIRNLKFGSYIDRTTELGTTFSCHLLARSQELNEKHNKKRIPFFGFNTPKMNAFNGLQEWQTDTHQHILYDDMIKDSRLIDYIFIHHRNKYIRVNLYENKKTGVFVFCHFFNHPKNIDKIVLTLQPQEINEVYGFGEFHPVVDLKNYVACFRSNLVYYSTNSVGDLVQNYRIELNCNKNKF